MIVSSSLDVLKIYKGFLTMEDEKDNNLFYGVELECLRTDNVVNSDVKLCKSVIDLEYAMYGHAVFKPDCGCEIVTVPATLRYHKEKLWNAFFSGVHATLQGASGVGLISTLVVML